MGPQWYDLTKHGMNGKSDGEVENDADHGSRDRAQSRAQGLVAAQVSSFGQEYSPIRPRSSHHQCAK